LNPQRRPPLLIIAVTTKKIGTTSMALKDRRLPALAPQETSEDLSTHGWITQKPTTTLTGRELAALLIIIDAIIFTVEIRLYDNI
jgi:hypothetical protein